ncbi:MAG: GPR1/FUN34/YaaH family transporter [Desulfobacteraceae bacterium]
MAEQTHSFATPGPAGLGALAVATFGFGAVFLGKVGLGGLPLLAAWLVGGGIVQFSTAVIELKDHNITGGNVFLFFSAFFMFGAALSVIAKFFMIHFGIAHSPYVEGWCWLAGAGFLTIVTPAYLKGPKTLFGIVILIDIALWLISFMDLGILSAGFKPVVAYALFASGALALYTAGAVVNNSVFGRTIIPLPAPFIK